MIAKPSLARRASSFPAGRVLRCALPSRSKHQVCDSSDRRLSWRHPSKRVALMSTLAIKHVILQLVSCSLFFAAVAGATEPWADVKFSPKDGLELWLDASREQPRARRPGWASSRAAIHLSSGMTHQVRSAMSDKATRRSSRSSCRSVPQMRLRRHQRPDGSCGLMVKMINLCALGANQTLADFTLFLVAAPHSDFG